METKEKIRYVLRKHPEAKYNRADFFWQYLTEIYKIKFYIMKSEFLTFMREFATLERSLRDVLKEDEFKLPPEQDAKRYKKAEEFRQEHKKKFEDTLSPEDKKIYNKMFNSNNEDYVNCYKCGKSIKKSEAIYLPVIESPSDGEVPPKAPFCRECAEELEENNG